jgi:glucose/arabinose dehydrogenase
LSQDGATLYASSADIAYSFAYNADDQTTSNRRTLVTGMDNPDHSTRTLLLSRLVDGMMLVSRGSADNVDLGAASLDSGRSQIRAFNLTELADGQSYDYTTQGLRLGWGLRNSVGVAEHPQSGGIWSVENSVMDIRYVMRHGTAMRSHRMRASRQVLSLPLVRRTILSMMTFAGTTESHHD